VSDVPSPPTPDGQPDLVPPSEPLPPLRLRAPIPPVVDNADGLRTLTSSVAAGTGPVALDAERASGYRYSQRAYLVQLRRCGTGTALVDPIAFDDLAVLDEAIGNAEWILHAATQDLPCLAEIGLRPTTLFDTELAGRLLNLPRVGLASLVQEILGHTLAKEHSAVDWSTRPLPDPWLEYAALDVEVLIELRAELDERLTAAGKREWADQEFEALLSFTGPRRRAEPWRRTSGIHKTRNRRSLAVVRELWQARDELAADRDVTPGRILPDSAISQIAAAQPKDRATLRSLTSLRARGARRYLDEWQRAVEIALALPDKQLPPVTAEHDGPPPPRTWADKNPTAAERLRACRESMATIAAEQDVPLENLLMPELVRRLAWEPPEPLDGAAVAQVLTAAEARAWQVELTADVLAGCLQAHAPT